MRTLVSLSTKVHRRNSVHVCRCHTFAGVMPLFQTHHHTLARSLRTQGGAHARSLYRLLRTLASFGVFEEAEDQTFRLTPNRLFLADWPTGLRPRTRYANLRLPGATPRRRGHVCPDDDRPRGESEPEGNPFRASARCRGRRLPQRSATRQVDSARHRRRSPASRDHPLRCAKRSKERGLHSAQRYAVDGKSLSFGA
jgi:hypothetical protein